MIRKTLSKILSIAREIRDQSYALYPLQKMQYTRSDDGEIALAEYRIYSPDGFGHLASKKDLKIELVIAYKNRKKMETGKSMVFPGRGIETYFGRMPNNLVVDKLSEDTVKVYTGRAKLEKGNYLVSQSEEELIKYRDGRSIPVLL